MLCRWELNTQLLSKSVLLVWMWHFMLMSLEHSWLASDLLSWLQFLLDVTFILALCSLELQVLEYLALVQWHFSEYSLSFSCWNVVIFLTDVWVHISVEQMLLHGCLPITCKCCEWLSVFCSSSLCFCCMLVDWCHSQNSLWTSLFSVSQWCQRALHWRKKKLNDTK